MKLKYKDQKIKLLNSLNDYISVSDEYKFRKGIKIIEDIFKDFFIYLRKTNWSLVEEKYPIIKNRFTWSSVKDIEKDIFILFKKAFKFDNEQIILDIFYTTINITYLCLKYENLLYFNTSMDLYKRYYNISANKHFNQDFSKKIVMFFYDSIFFNVRYLFKSKEQDKDKILLNKFLLNLFKEYYLLMIEIVKNKDFKLYELAVNLFLNEKNTFYFSSIDTLKSKEIKLEFDKPKNYESELFALEIKIKLYSNPYYQYILFCISVLSFITDSYKKHEITSQEYYMFLKPIKTHEQIKSYCFFDAMLNYFSSEHLNSGIFGTISPFFRIDIDKLIFFYAIYLLFYDPINNEIEKIIIKNKLYNSSIIYILEKIKIYIQQIYEEYHKEWFKVFNISDNLFNNSVNNNLSYINKYLKIIHAH